LERAPSPSVEDMTDHKNWFITGASRGFGREWTIAALERGDRVAATARDTSTLDDLVSTYGDRLLPLQLDVTDRAADLEAVAQAHETFGRLDVVVNNAGYGHFGFAEEVSEDDLRRQMETNFFGLVWVTQAALPYLRAQGSGHIVQVTSIGGISAFPLVSAYHASKWAVEGFTQSMAAEVKGFGIDVTLVEPAGFATDWGGSSAAHSEPLPAYDEVRKEMMEARKRRTSDPGDPQSSAQALLRIVDADEPPLRCFFGAQAFGIARADYESRLATWEAWDDVAQLAQG
jgi:NAD(P)-dependent dehydrogenase (short-subunit alcohol dehydrogenase family)